MALLHLGSATAFFAPYAVHGDLRLCCHRPEALPGGVPPRAAGLPASVSRGASLRRCLAFFLAAGVAHRRGGGWAARRRRRQQAETSAAARAAVLGSARGAQAPVEEMHSPFEEGDSAAPAQGGAAAEPGEEPLELPLTLENVEAVLDELRPYLQSDGGDCRVVEIDGPVVRLELEGACSSCSASSVTLKMGIERTLRQRIPQISEVVAVLPNQETLTEQGLEEVLDGIRPFLETAGGTVALQEIVAGVTPRVVLRMTGPPVKSAAVRVEVTGRVRNRFPMVLQVDVVD